MPWPDRESGGLSRSGVRVSWLHEARIGPGKRAAPLCSKPSLLRSSVGSLASPCRVASSWPTPSPAGTADRRSSRHRPATSCDVPIARRSRPNPARAPSHPPATRLHPGVGSGNGLHVRVGGTQVTTTGR